jgi:hypothetical protein
MDDLQELSYWSIGFLMMLIVVVVFLIGISGNVLRKK